MARSDKSAEKTRERYSRRRWLQTAGLAGATMLAGCGGDGGDDGTTTTSAPTTTSDDNGGMTTTEPGTTTEPEGEPVDRVMDGLWSTSTAPQDLDWNPFTAGAYPNTPGGFSFEFGGYQNATTNELHLSALESWDYDGDSQVLTFNLQPDLQYWNGDSYTAEDWIATHRVTHLLSPDGSQWSELATPDETTAEYTYKIARNPDILSLQMVTEWATIGTVVWDEWIEQLEDATSQDQRDQISSDLSEFSIESDQFIDEGLGTGPYQLVEMNDNGLRFEMNEDHRNADQLEIETWRMPFVGGQARIDENVTNDVYDFAPGTFPPRYEGAAPEYLETLTSWQAKQMIKMNINWRNREWLQDANVRRAMAAVINTQDIVTVFGENIPVAQHSGMDAGFTQSYVGDPADDYIEYYPSETRADLADQFLEMSGYSRENGTVVDPDGEELEPARFLVSQTGLWGTPAQVASQQLANYGFPIDSRSVTRDTKITIMHQQMTEWDLSSESHYAAGTSHPFSYFDYGTVWGWRLGPAFYGPDAGLDAQIQGWLDDGLEFSPYNGKPFTPEIPTTVGEQTLDGDTKEINIFELIQEVQTPISGDRTQEIIRDLSWAWNFHVPDIDLMGVEAGVWGDTRDFTWPDDETQLQVVEAGAYYVALKHGWIGYVYE